MFRLFSQDAQTDELIVVGTATAAILNWIRAQKPNGPTQE